MKTLLLSLLVAMAFSTAFSQASFAGDPTTAVSCGSSGQTRDLQAMLRQMKTQWSIKGEASYYGRKFHGRQTANGEVFSIHKRTAAMKIYRNKCVTVRNLSTNQQAYVWINDDGPHAKDENGKPRVIDLSPASKDAIGARSTEDVEVLPTAKSNCASISPRARS
jgi:rare lipoprotein A (peptidoglycan hydrolase)